MSQRRTICVVTGSRADYGHLSSLLKAIKGDGRLKLQIAVTGMHLSPRFGNTYKHILKDGFKISAKADILKFDNSEAGIAQAVGLGCQKFAKVFQSLKPDVVVVLGDRYEIFSAVVAAYIAKIPVAHIHGGEKSEGSMDEGIRHAITKMTSLHFAATEEYRKRIIQLGEDPKRVFNFGAPGLDGLHQLKLLTKNELEKKLAFHLNYPTAIVTYHPVTLEKNSSQKMVKNLLSAVESTGINAVFTKSNADPRGEAMNAVIGQFCRKNPSKYLLVDALGQQGYYSCLKHCDVMIGNSSSGLVEAPSFQMPVVNIGDRQRNRIKAKNVIDVAESDKAIIQGIRTALSSAFKQNLKGLKNPYEKFADGKTGQRIKNVLKSVPLSDELLKKKFYDLKFSER